MVARNFLEEDSNLLYPRIDIGGEKTGITGMEFPLLNYLIFLVAKVFGYDHWYGRLINLLVSTLGLWFFYKLVSKYFGKEMGFRSTFFLCLSIWFTYSRKMMPDTFSVSFVIAGIYYGTNYLDRGGSWRSLIAYLLCATIGILSKLPAGYLLVVLLLFVFDSRISLARKLGLCLCSILVIISAGVYYFYWVPHLNRTFGFEHFFMGKSASEGLSDTLNHLNEFAEKFYLQAMGLSGFLFFVIGLYLTIRKKNRPLLGVLLLTSAAFCIVIVKSGFAFYHHDYYIVPFAPIMVLIGAFAFNELNQKWIYAGLAIYALEAIPRKNTDFYIKEENLAIMTLEPKLDSLGSRSDLVFINSGNVPTPVYFSHRKGWVGSNSDLENANYVSELKRLGLKHIVILKQAFGSETHLQYPVTFENKDFIIYRP